MESILYSFPSYLFRLMTRRTSQRQLRSNQDRLESVGTSAIDQKISHTVEGDGILTPHSQVAMSPEYISDTKESSRMTTRNKRGTEPSKNLHSRSSSLDKSCPKRNRDDDNVQEHRKNNVEKEITLNKEITPPPSPPHKASNSPSTPKRRGRPNKCEKEDSHVPRRRSPPQFNDPDVVINAVCKVLFKYGNEPKTPRDLAQEIVDMQMCHLEGPNPTNVVSSRIHHHIKVAAESRSGKTALLARVADENLPRRTSYILTRIPAEEEGDAENAVEEIPAKEESLIAEGERIRKRPKLNIKKTSSPPAPPAMEKENSSIKVEEGLFARGKDEENSRWRQSSPVSDISLEDLNVKPIQIFPQYCKSSEEQGNEEKLELARHSDSLALSEVEEDAYANLGPSIESPLSPQFLSEEYDESDDTLGEPETRRTTPEVEAEVEAEAAKQAAANIAVSKKPILDFEMQTWDSWTQNPERVGLDELDGLFGREFDLDI